MTLHVSYIAARYCESNYSVRAQEPSIKESSTHEVTPFYFCIRSIVSPEPMLICCS